MRKFAATAGILSCALCAVAAHAQSCINVPEASLPHDVNMDQVRDTWLSWNNQLRAEKGLAPYVLDENLNITAGNWAAYAAKRGSIDHKRYKGSPYYDYSAIEDWFSDKGVTFENLNRYTFTENIGWGPYSCAAKDCTGKLSNEIRSTFDFYLSEKNRKDKPHYNSLMNPSFQRIGIGIAENTAQKRYYLVVHYGTELTSSPVQACSQ